MDFSHSTVVYDNSTIVRVLKVYCEKAGHCGDFFSEEILRKFCCNVQFLVNLIYKKCKGRQKFKNIVEQN